MSSFFSRLLRPEKRADSPQGQGRENRKRHSPSIPSVDGGSERSASLEKQQKVLPIFHAENAGNKSPKLKSKHAASSEMGAQRKRNKRAKQYKSSKGFSSLFCMSGNSDTLERMPMPARKRPENRSDQKKPMKIGGSVADKVVKRGGKKIQMGKYRHSAPAQGYQSVMSKGIEDEVARLTEQGSENFESPRNSTSSPVQYRFDGTLQRPYVFPGGLTFIAGRKNGKNYTISPDKTDPSENAKSEVSADVHRWSSLTPGMSADMEDRRWSSAPRMCQETPVYHDGQTSWISTENQNTTDDVDVRKQFTLKYDDRVDFTGDFELYPASDVQSHQSRGHRSSTENLSNTEDPQSSFPLRKGVSLEILNKTNATHDKYGTGRYSLPQRDSSCVYMGSFQNLTLLTLKRNTSSRPAAESDYFKSKQKLFRTGRKNHYSLPTLNHDFVCMGSFDDINVESMKDNNLSDSEEEGVSNFQRMGRGRCSMSLPDLSQKLEYTLFDLPPVLSDSDGSASDSDDQLEDKSDSNSKRNNNYTHKDISPGRNPFSRNVGRGSCMPGNKRFFIPPPPCFTPPKDEMASVQSALSKLSCHKGSQVDISVDVLDQDMEDRDNSLGRNTDVRRLSSSITDLSKDCAKPLSLPLTNKTTLKGDIDGTQDNKTIESQITNINHSEHSSDKYVRNENDNGNVMKNIDDVVHVSKTDENVNQTNIVLDTVRAKERPETVKTSPSLSMRPMVPVTSTPKAARKTIPQSEKITTPHHTPRPIPRLRKSLIKTQSMCLSKNSSDVRNSQERPVPRARRSLTPSARPQSEIIETTSFTDYMDEQQNKMEKRCENVDIRTRLESIWEPFGPETTRDSSSETPTSKTDASKTAMQMSETPAHSILGRMESPPNTMTPRTSQTQRGFNDSGCMLATPGPIQSHRSYRLAMQKSDLCLEGHLTSSHHHTDSSTSNDEDTDVCQKTPLNRPSQDEDHCAADDEMSMGEEDVRPSDSNILRSGSILDRSLILANKHRLRMRERKCNSQLLSSTETDDTEEVASNAHPSRATGNGIPQKVVSFAKDRHSWIDNNLADKSMDSGTFSDCASPLTSPVVPHTSSRVSFVSGDHREMEDASSTPLGVKRQTSVQKKPWEVRMRKKHWMRRTRENAHSWHCGPDVAPPHRDFR